ncbi:Cellulose synthase [Macleaya cordata]|uniref:Cellulose synthase n=1 Tax=Macleaya cordata TaxID=56857 RepID=A0A200PN45_MACCD|nr:Cellulose synthase [Macleaya cordata]
MWRPVTRTAFPERLNCKDEELPAVDVFICTADPAKEPVIEVMNTVLSSMALDYPTEKLFVYLSDDAGSSITLSAIRETWVFAKSWVPFCRKFGIKTRCPQAYFSRSDDENDDSLYELLKERIEKAGQSVTPPSQDRAPHIEVINDTRGEAVIDYQTNLPLLIYVAREKRQSYPHHFKAGALNSLLRVSGMISNSPYILVLDCDMYCNDPTSARQAMCFHLDPQINRSLAFVQFPQIFYSISKNDIYDGQMRSAFKTKWQGMDGIKGPVLSGTGFYLKRQALYGSPNQKEKYFVPEMELHQLKEFFGTSNEFVASLHQNYRSNIRENKASSSNTQLQDSRILASCDYEKDTKWGEQASFLYQCLLESTFTGYYLHCQGWNSVYLYPSRPAFLGCPATNMNDALVQGMKWSSELFRVGLSTFCPLTYAFSRMSILQTMCYMYFIFSPLFGVAISLYATVTQLCLFNGIPLYPKVSDPWFVVFVAAYVGCIGQHLFEGFSKNNQ